ncbi:hypothetical protein RRG08_037299 [Elysia crispata]|uniref:Uncharacterized protein n=1 Tax=Elysia crispata TaxID=231223 RepID=A0AAE1DXT6_9GAST|nr:hypothetical protein RRG08_037299 [Elysia crispata]
MHCLISFDSDQAPKELNGFDTAPKELRLRGFDTAPKELNGFDTAPKELRLRGFDTALKELRFAVLIQRQRNLCCTVSTQRERN